MFAAVFEVWSNEPESSAYVITDEVFGRNALRLL